MALFQPFSGLQLLFIKQIASFRLVNYYNSARFHNIFDKNCKSLLFSIFFLKPHTVLFFVVPFVITPNSTGEGDWIYSTLEVGCPFSTATDCYRSFISFPDQFPSFVASSWHFTTFGARLQRFGPDHRTASKLLNSVQ